MSVANDVLKWAKKNVSHSGSGNDIYVPNQNSYPHMHITNGYVGYSTSGTHRKKLVEGDDVFKGPVRDTASEAVGGAQAVAVFIRDSWVE